MSNNFDSASVLLLGLPDRAFCGIDLLSFTSSPKFQGIKNLPAGWHFVFVSPTNSFSLRHGAWFYVEEEQDDSSPSLFVLKWDSEREELVPETSTAEVLKWRANIGSLWRANLTPYRQTAGQESDQNANGTDEKQDWPQLTDCITSSLLSRITTDTEQSTKYWLFTSASSSAQDVDDIPGISNSERAAHTEKELRFLPIDLKQTWRPGAVGRERTQAAQDRSWALGQLIQEHCEEPRDLIGELQCCFLLILTLNNNSALEQWKRLLGLVLTCKEAAGKQPSFFCEFLGVLRLQMEHCDDAEGGLFDLADEGGGLLKALLKRFRAGVEGLEVETVRDVLDELHDLEVFMRDEYGWMGGEPIVRRGMLELEDGEQVQVAMDDADEEDESGDYAATVVELSAEEQKLLGIDGEQAEKQGSPLPLRTKAVIQTQETQSEDEPDEVPHEFEHDDGDIEELDARY